MSPDGGDGESWFERAEPVAVEESVDEPAPEVVEEYADPQEWIGGLISALERAEQGIGSGPRDALMARIKLAQAYSELGDMVQAAPLAVANVSQAERLFPSSEGMLRQLREFRDAACEAAGWTAAMMREPDEAFGALEEEPSELVARPEMVPATEAVAAAEAVAVAVAAAETVETVEYAPIPEPVAEPATAEALQAAEPEPAGAVIHEFVRRAPEPDEGAEEARVQWTAEAQTTATTTSTTPPAELAIPTPPEPEYAEEVEPALAPTDLTGLTDLSDLSDLADLAAIEEIIRLRYELREAHRTIERLRHVNRKLREALDFDGD